MDIVRETNIDFMKYRKFWIWVSVLLVGIGVASIFSPVKLNLGIDFRGGTQLTLRFQQAPDVEELRAVAESTGVRDVQIQRFGQVADNQVILKTSTVEGSESGSGPKVIAALNDKLNAGAGGVDLNQIGREALLEALTKGDPLGVGTQSTAAPVEYGKVVDQVLAARKQAGILSSVDQVTGLDPKVSSFLKSNTHTGKFAVLGVENVGAVVGGELRTKGLLAVFWSLVGMLVFIALRFELPYGVGATMATIHDVLVTVGLFTIFGFEWNLTTIAAFLTLIGYSVNDTVVTFDRVRENIRKSRGEALINVMNKSLNQMLSRTLLTGGTVILAAGSLMFLGGDVLRGFAFILFVGVLVGTYSSIYVASPFALLWVNRFGAKGRMAIQAAPAKKAAPVASAPTAQGRANGGKRAARR
jgi:preprotein translocase subunit SecF